VGRKALAVRKRQIEILLPHHQAMARAEACGARPGDLAKRFGLENQTISLIRNSPLFKAEVKRVRMQLEEGTLDVQKELLMRCPRSLEVVDEELYQPERSPARTRAAFEILDRTGYSKQREPQHVGDTYNIAFFAPLPGEDPEVAKRRIADLRRQREIIETIELVDQPSTLPTEGVEVEIPEE
jgi:hypothetical protein